FQGTEGEQEEKSEYWSRGKAIMVLLVATGFVALLSEFLVGTIESMRATFGITETFVGIIVVAIIGNAAEHSTAILMALKNKMDLTVGIAIGSSLQIALFVAPLLLFVSYFFGEPMNLEFSLPEVFAVVVRFTSFFKSAATAKPTGSKAPSFSRFTLSSAFCFFICRKNAPTSLQPFRS